MKVIRIMIGLLLFVLLTGTSAMGQQERYQMYVVHEDKVHKDKVAQHTETDKALVKAAREHKMNGMSWLTFVADDNRVLYLSPIKNMAELDMDPFEDLQKKMGKEAFEKLFENYKGTYTVHGDYILRLDNELSYMPDGMTITPEGENYRELAFYHIPAGREPEAEELARKVKALYSEKGSRVHYRLYKSGFGNMGYYYMVAVSAKSPEAMESKRKSNMDLLGDEGKAIFDEIENLMSKRELVRGHIKPELSYVNN